MRGASGLLLLAVLLAGVGVGDGKILGARMSWELNPLFEGDDVTSVRKVTLKLTSAWETVGVCTAVVGQAVSGAGCVVESNFGQLCWYACRDVTNMACDPIQCVDNALVRDQPPGLDSEIFSQPYFQGTLTQEVTVPENKDMVVAFLKWADPSGGTFEMTSGGRSDYWVGFDPANSALFAPDMNPIVPTFIPLCTGAPETDGSVATCRLGQLENYYSPVPVYPLIVASPPDLSMQAPSYLKVSDLDGHQLKVEKAQSYVSGAWSSDPRENQGDLFHDVDPAGPSNGPQVLYSSIVGSRYTAKWIEVVDRTYDRLEPTDLQSSYKIFSRYSDTQASVQLALSVLDPSAGRCSATNPPPFFTAAAGGTAPLGASHVTEMECEWVAGFPGAPNCAIPLHAHTPGTAAGSYYMVRVRSAFGFPALDTACGDTQCEGDSRPCCCRSQGGKTCEYVPKLGEGAASNPALLGNPWTQDDIGKFFVSCFVATAERYNLPVLASNGAQEGPCPSLPMCVKVRITGRKPRFVAPTPLAPNSRDSAGADVPGRTDVGACLGYPLQLTLKAEDPDAGDGVRIFVTDPVGGTGNFDFFASQLTGAQANGTFDCGTFGPYGAVRTGDNANQTSASLLDFPPGLQPTISADSVMAKLKPTVSFSSGGAGQGVAYTLRLGADNGVVNRPQPNPSLADQNYRQLVLNVDQVVCGAAFDDSRTRYKRWVGERVDGDAGGFEWQRQSGHALGDLRSDIHCWKVKLQAPPVFVTDGSKGCFRTANGGQQRIYDCTPIGGAPGDYFDTGQTTGNESAYRNIPIGAGQELHVTFVAADPNPEDQVTLFVLEDPGVPPNMVVGRSTCTVHSEAQYICLARDEVTSEYPNQNYTIDYYSAGASPCQRATLKLTWTPADTDVGQSFKVCPRPARAGWGARAAAWALRSGHCIVNSER